MSDDRITIYCGGCLCGALRYEARGEPTMTGHCYCADCRKASGSGFIAFLSFPNSAIRIDGESHIFVCKSARGSDAVRNSCPVCASLVFGGERGKDTSFTVYAGSLDEPQTFKPQIAIFTRARPDWAMIPQGLKSFDTLPVSP
jgi:hypothetical protein